VIAIGIAVLLVVAAIGDLAARIMMGPEEMALLRAARATAAQRRLVAAAAQQERAARAAAAQQGARRTRSSRQRHPPRIELSNVYWTRIFKLQWEDALAAPLPPRLAILITQLETQAVSAETRIEDRPAARRARGARQWAAASPLKARVMDPLSKT